MHFSISRRRFLALCAMASLPAVACDSGKGGFVGSESSALPSGTKILWLQSAGCSGCTVSFLNRISEDEPETAADALLEVVVVGYHSVLMAAAGETAAELANRIYDEGQYLLVVEGGIATAFGGMACGAWTVDGEHVNMKSAVKRLAGRALGVIALGSCASFGGVSAAGTNPAQVKPVSAVTGTAHLVNLPGCPANPDWFLLVLTQFLTWMAGKGPAPEVDRFLRPKALFSRFVHDQCSRLGSPLAVKIGVDHECLYRLGCQGPRTQAPCPTLLWNGGRNWCVDANGLCLGCTEPTFPGARLVG